MMNRGLGEMFYGRRPVQYMQCGGLSGWGELAAAGAVGGSVAVGGAGAVAVGGAGCAINLRRGGGGGGGGGDDE